MTRPLREALWRREGMSHKSFKTSANSRQLRQLPRTVLSAAASARSSAIGVATASTGRNWRTAFTAFTRLAGPIKRTRPTPVTATFAKTGEKYGTTEQGCARMNGELVTTEKS